MAQHAWLRLGLWWNISIPAFNTMGDIWCWLDGLQMTNNNCKRLWVTITAMLKSLWDSRNEMVFNNKSKGKEVTFKGAQNLAYNWLISRNNKFCLDRETWFSFPYN